MKKKKLKNSTYNNYISAMLELIELKGSLSEVNLRMISKHIGCAHTNAYNYFDGYNGLIYEAYDEALTIYRSNIIKNLMGAKTYKSLFSTFLGNIIEFALNNQGLYRFIGSDNFAIEGLLPKSIDKAIALKKLFIDIFIISTGTVVPDNTSINFASIIMSYVDGELFNIINQRTFPEKDLDEKIIRNALLLMNMFILDSGSDFNYEVILDQERLQLLEL